VSSLNKIFPSMVIGIFCINILIIVIPIHSEDFSSSDNSIVVFLRGLGLEIKSNEIYHQIPRLLSTSQRTSQPNQSYLTGMRFSQSQYSVPGWADTRWKYRKNITIDYTKVISDVNNFPVLIDLYDPDLQNEAQASGNDMLFTDSSGYILDHEIEQYRRVYNSTHAHLIAWVKTNLSSTQDTIISMYYGNPTVSSQESLEGVWDNNYVGIWHLAEDPTEVIYDSSSFGNDGTSVGSMTSNDQVRGVIDGCLVFDGIDDYIDTGNDSSLDITGDITIQFWVKAENYANDPDMLTKGSYTQAYSSFIYDANDDNSDGVIYFKLNDHNLISTSTLNTGTWYSVAGTREGNTMRIYINGLEDATDTYSTSIETIIEPLTIALSPDNLNGTMDEVRLSNVARSSDWIATEYNNQIDSTSFYTIGSKDSYGVNSWANNMFRYRKNVTIKASEVSGDLTNFPVLIELFDADLHNSEKVQPEGNDIIFVDESGSRLDHEIEFFNQTFNSTHAYLVAWVNIPSLLNSQNTTISMYYGNPAVSSQENPEGVWDNNYVGVWHLGESTGDVQDSTFYKVAGTSYSSVTQGVSGSIAKASDFAGVTNYNNRIDMGDQDHLDFGDLDDFSVEFWFYLDSYGATDYQFFVIKREETYYGSGYGVGLNCSSGLIGFGGCDANDNFEVHGGTSIVEDTWYHVVAVWDQSSASSTTIYLNGLEDKDFTVGTIGSINSLSNSQPFKLGHYFMDGYHYPLNGRLDEIRISNSVRSSAWVNTSYNNQHDPTSFYSVSTEEKNQNWWSDRSFNKRRDIVINRNEVEGDLTDFPILIKLSDNSFKTGKIQPDGADILFVDMNGTKLAHEIESFSQNSTHGDLVTWVKVPLLKSSEDTIISMYYGNSEVSNQENPSVVWDANYRGVWHLNNDPTSTINDSTSNNFDGSSGGSMTQTDLVSAKLATGIDFDGTNDFIAFPDPLNTETMTISAWVFLKAAVNDWITVAMRATTDVSWFDWQLYARASDGELSNEAVYRTVYPSTSEVGSNFVLSTGIWYYVVGQHNGTHNLFFIDGTLSEVDQDPNSVKDSNRNMWIGGNEVWGEWLQGILDEVRVSSIARSSEWISAQYNNQFNSSSFYSIGPEFSQTAEITIEESLTAEAENVNQITILDVSGVPHHLYVLTASSKAYSDTTSVTGLGLNWTELEDQPGGRSQTGISVWYAIGSNPSTGDITVTLASSPKAVAVQVHRFSGINIYDPIGDTESANTNGENGLGSGGSDNPYPTLDIVTTTSMATIFGAIGRRHVTISMPGQGYTLLSENQIGVSGDIAGISTEYKTNQEVGTVVVNATLSSNCDWGIVGVELKPAVIDIKAPVVVDFGVDDPGMGTGTFWANITDNLSVFSAKLKINGTEYEMTDNGTHWVYSSSVTFNNNYVYQIIDSTDAAGNSLAFSSEKNYTFFKDTMDPTVLDWEYYDTLGPYGTFKANVTDSWGEIDTVRVNVTTYNMQAFMGRYTTYGGTIFAYLNDTLEMPNGIMNFQIIVNDTAGNEFISSTHQGDVFSNHPPIAENLTLSPAIPWSNCSLTLTYDYYDEDSHGEAGTEIHWYRNNGSGFQLYSSYIYPADGPVSLERDASELFPDDQWYVNVTPKDGGLFGETNMSAIITILNTPPSVSDVIVFYSGSDPYTTSTLNIDYTYDDHEGDTEDTNNQEVEWYRNGTHYLPLDNSTSVSPGNTTKGETWYYRIRVHDGTGYSGWVTSDTVLIHNSLPQAVNLTLTSNPTTLDDLVAAWDVADADGDSEDLNAVIIYWYKDGENQSAWTNLTIIEAGNTSKGESWRFEIRVFDGENYSALTALNPPVVILNSAPTVSNVELTPTTPVTTDGLTATWDDADADSDSLTYIIRWYIVGVGVQAAYNDLSTIPASVTTKSQTWYYNLTVFDGTDYSLEVSSSQVTIQNTLPEVTNLALTAAPKTITNLVASWTAADNDTSDTLTFNVTWYLDGEVNCSWFTSVTSTTLDAGNTTKGDSWSFTVQAYDGEAYSSLISLGYNRTILNTAPVVANLTITSNPMTTDSLVAAFDYTDTDVADNTSLVFNITWYCNGLEQSNLANITSVGAGNTNKSQFWWFTVQAFDGESFSLKYESVHVQILNTAPNVANLVIIPLSPTTTMDLVVSWDDLDADNDSLTYTIRWYIVGVGLQSAYNDLTTVPASATVKGQTWYYNLTVFDGDDYSPETNSSQVVILNSSPEVDSLEVTTNPTSMNDLVASWNANDNDTGDSLTFNVTWYLNGEVNCSWLTSVTSATLDAGNTTKGQIWNVTVQTYDGEAYSSILSLATTITILNSKPTVFNPSFNDTSPDEGDDFHITYTFVDVDVGDVEELNKIIVYWYINWNYNASFQNQTTIYAANTTATEVWYYIIRVFDGEAYSDNVTSEQGVYIGGGSTNTRPMAIDLTLTPSTPQTHEALVANYTFSDVDADPQVAYEIRWYRNSGAGFQLQSQYNNLYIVPASATSKGQQWNFTVRVFDGIQWSELNVSTSITIANTNPVVNNAGITSSPQTTDDLVASWDSSDNDSDSLTFILTWYVNGIENATFVNKTVIEAGNTTKGENWYFTVQAYDGEGLSSTISLGENITILNTAPLASNLTITTNPTTLDDLVASWDYFDIDGDLRDDALAWITWFKNGENQTVLANQQYVGSSNTSKNQVWWFIVRLFDGENYSIADYESAHIQILNSPPIVENLGISILNPKTTDILTAQWGADDNDSDILSYTIKWYRNTIYQPAWDNEITIPASGTSKGETWYYTLKAFDGSEYSSEETLTPGILILNTIPIVDNLALTIDPQTTDDLVGSWASSDNDGDSLTFIVKWYVNGIENTTYLNKTVVEAGNTTKGENWYFTVQAYDGEGLSSVISLAANVTILNTPPIASNLVITNNPTTLDSLIADWDYFDVDNDPRNDTLAQITWFKNGENQTALVNQKTVGAANTSKNQVWWFTVQVFDGENYSIGIYESAHISIQNAIPYRSSALPLPTNPTKSNGMVLNLSAIIAALSDPDPSDDIEVVNIRWYKEGILQNDLNNALTVSGTRLSKGERWNYSIVPFDGVDYGAVCVSAEIVILNSKPMIINTYFTKTVVTTINNLVISFQAEDADGDNITISGVRWYWYDAGIPGWVYNDTYDDYLTLPAMATTKGESWKYQLEVFDGTESSLWKEAAKEVDIINSQPYVDPFSIILTGGTTTSDPLQVTYAWYDDDPGDSSTQTIITWENSGDYLEDTYSTTLSADETFAGERWWVTITPYDGEDYGDYVNSKRYGISVIIGNTPPNLDPENIEITGELNGTEYQGTSFGTVFNLNLHYNASDLDGDQDVPAYGLSIIDGFALGSEYRWYRNRSGVTTLISVLNDKISVPFYYTQKGDNWWVQVRPRDFYGDFGVPRNSSQITIGNTAPQIIELHWLRTTYDTTNDLTFGYTIFDYDTEDTQKGVFIQWYQNGTHLSGFDNNTVISSQFTKKGEIWYVNISVFDGESYSTWYQLLAITIRNSAPTAIDILLTPFSPNTTQSLMATWIFNDVDNDTENQVAALIKWYRNGILVYDLENNQTVPSSLTNREESWYFTIQVTDGYNYSVTIYMSNTITIINSAPAALDLQINDGTEIYTTDDLILTWNFNDSDILDIEDRSSTLILWYLNGIEQLAFANLTIIPASHVVKGQQWNVSIRVCDNGGLWSEFLNSSLIVIKNSVPTLTIHGATHPEFIIEDEALEINSSFYSYIDADGDENQPIITWYCNNKSMYQNVWIILTNDTLPGDVWYYTIQAFDGTDFGIERISPEISIESRPVIHNFVATALPDTEGHYELEINVTDSHNEIKQVEFLLGLNTTNELSPFVITSPKSPDSTLWLLDYTLDTYSYLETPTLVRVTVVTEVIYSTTYEILLTETFTFTFEDKAPPRVLNAYFEMDDEINPTNLTFYTEVQDFGPGIKEVILFYYFRPSEELNQTGGNGAALLREDLEWLDVPMMVQVSNETGQFVLYMVIVDFVHASSNLDIIYRISTEDKANNSNLFAFDIRDYPQRIIGERFIYQPPGLPEWVLLVAVLVIFIIFIGSIVYVKFIRKPELVGLDKDLVLAKISDITEAEVLASLDAHTIGVVVSFFDQRHGPIPIIILPEILKDNFTKLVDLSDRSFSGTGFADDFSVEIPSSYDFVLSHGIRTSVMSFGFALERPDSRGGQENLTCNIIIHQDLFPLVQSFQNEIKRKVHAIHVRMDKNPSEKDEIRKEVFTLRKYVSSIILSYANIYGTTELIEEES